MVEWIHPGVIIILGAFLLPVLKYREIKQVYLVLLPTAGLLILILTSMGVFGSIPAYPAALHKWRIPFLHYTLELGRIDKMSMIFAYVYVVIGIAMLITNALFIPLLSAVLAAANEVILKLIIYITSILSKLPLAWLEVQTPPVLMIIIYYLILAIAPILINLLIKKPEEPEVGAIQEQDL